MTPEIVTLPTRPALLSLHAIHPDGSMDVCASVLVSRSQVEPLTSLRYSALKASVLKTLADVLELDAERLELMEVLQDVPPVIVAA